MWWLVYGTTSDIMMQNLILGLIGILIVMKETLTGILQAFTL